MKFEGVLYFGVFLFVSVFVLYFYLGGFTPLKSNYAQEDFSAILNNCNFENSSAQVCFNELDKFLSERGVDNHKIIYVYPNQKKFKDEGDFLIGVVVDRVEIEKLQGSEFVIERFTGNYMGFNLPKKIGISINFDDWRINQLLIEKFISLDRDYGKLIRVEDTINSELNYLIEVL